MLFRSALNEPLPENGLYSNALSGSDRMELYMTCLLYTSLETITLDKESAHFKAQMAQKYADIVYNGQWFTPLREALDAFADSWIKFVISRAIRPFPSSKG